MVIFYKKRQFSFSTPKWDIVFIAISTIIYVFNVKLLMHNKLTNYQQDIKYSMGNSFLLLCINGDAWKDFIKTPAFLYEVMMGFLILHFFLFWMPSRDHQKANHIYAVTRETGVSVAIMLVVVDVVDKHCYVYFCRWSYSLLSFADKEMNPPQP